MPAIYQDETVSQAKERLRAAQCDLSRALKLASEASDRIENAIANVDMAMRLEESRKWNPEGVSV